MKNIYLAVKNKLQEKVPELRWIGTDEGQLDFYDKPPVAFPCALIDIDLPDCTDLNRTEQDCDAIITIRIAFLPIGQTNNLVPQEVEEKALERWEIIDKCFDNLQGFEKDTFDPLSRSAQITEKREDPLRVVKQSYTTSFEAAAKPI